MTDRRVLAAIPESEFQAQVLQLATLTRWRSYHTFDSRRSREGFPDLILLRDGRMVVAELKRVGRKPTPEQAAWLADFAKVRRVEVYTWTPESWDEIEWVLR